MSVVGIIAEYNPFHSGHEFLMNQARLLAGDDPVIVVMSGNYVQRGEMAILDKWSRAKAALAAGADLVFELPFSYAVQPADMFATGGVELLTKLGCNDLVFGVEDGVFAGKNRGDSAVGAIEDIHLLFNHHHGLFLVVDRRGEIHFIGLEKFVIIGENHKISKRIY